MAFFISKGEMYEAKANRSEKNGRMHWAKAKNGDGDFHFSKVKKCFAEAGRNKNWLKIPVKNEMLSSARGRNELQNQKINKR